MQQIHLVGLEFFAYHGVYDQERKEGNTFLVDVKIEYDFLEAAKEDDLSKTIDYAIVYELVSGIMGKQVKLLETLTLCILDSVYSRFPQIHAAEVTVSKLNPPFGGKARESRVTMSR